MNLIPLPSPLLRPGDDLIAALDLRARIEPGDILVVSSKAVATVEGAVIDVSQMHVSDEARAWSDATGRSPAFCQAVLQEVKILNGTILRAVPGALLTEVRPRGMAHGTILVANAGLDESNTQAGTAVGWPEDVVSSMREMQASIVPSSIPRPLPPSAFAPLGATADRLEEGEFWEKKPLQADVKLYARKMRKNPTKGEAAFWQAVRNDQLGVRVRRQYPIEKYILDFYIPSLHLGIEIDGGYHTATDQQQVADEWRDAALMLEHGVHVLHFSNEEVLHNLPTVLSTIKAVIGGSPSPVERGPGGEGGRSIAIILSDSTCSPRRRGVTAIALACCGIDPFTSTIGNDDLYGRKMTITVEATADQLATAANAVMGNAAQSIPAVLIRDHGIPYAQFCGWVPGIEKEEDLFGSG
jgi:F420-0:gamma-glutamyl ligase/very-short-patch-repair endonuclease